MIKQLLTKLVPSACKEDFTRARSELNRTLAKTEKLCNNIICMYDTHRDKINYEVSTPNASRTAAN
ncbi:hypothetical protein EKK58_09070 [Candidatus Dependentiae bacterium]|nr:MAG: hypothetical protein EKK58_09070 [Candidatus Dependentiae bacterium]